MEADVVACQSFANKHASKVAVPPLSLSLSLSPFSKRLTKAVSAGHWASCAASGRLIRRDDKVQDRSYELAKPRDEDVDDRLQSICCQGTFLLSHIRTKCTSTHSARQPKPFIPPLPPPVIVPMMSPALRAYTHTHTHAIVCTRQSILCPPDAQSEHPPSQTHTHTHTYASIRSRVSPPKRSPSPSEMNPPHWAAGVKASTHIATAKALLTAIVLADGGDLSASSDNRKGGSVRGRK